MIIYRPGCRLQPEKANPISRIESECPKPFYTIAYVYSIQQAVLFAFIYAYGLTSRRNKEHSRSRCFPFACWFLRLLTFDNELLCKNVQNGIRGNIPEVWRSYQIVKSNCESIGQYPKYCFSGSNSYVIISLVIDFFLFLYWSLEDDPQPCFNYLM